MKTLHILTTITGLLLFAGCESKPADEAVLPNTQTVSETAHQSPSEKKVMALQLLDDQYKAGSMTAAEYSARQEAILGQY